MLASARIAMGDWVHKSGESESWRGLRDVSLMPTQLDSTPKHFRHSALHQAATQQRNESAPAAMMYSQTLPFAQQNAGAHSIAFSYPNETMSNQHALSDAITMQHSPNTLGGHMNTPRAQDISDFSNTNRLLPNRREDLQLPHSFSTQSRRQSGELASLLHYSAASRAQPAPSASMTNMSVKVSLSAPHQVLPGSSSSLTGATSYNPSHGERTSHTHFSSATAPSAPLIHHDVQDPAPNFYSGQTIQHGHLQASPAASLSTSPHDGNSVHYSHMPVTDTPLNAHSHYGYHHGSSHHPQSHFGFHEYRSYPMISPFEVKHRRRTTRAQYKVLHDAFQRHHKPSASMRKQLSEQTGMPLRSVQIWFQNSRAKLRREQRAKEGSQTKKEDAESANELSPRECVNTGSSNESSTLSDAVRKSEMPSQLSSARHFGDHFNSGQSIVSGSHGSVQLHNDTYPYGISGHAGSASTSDSRPSTSTLSHASGSTMGHSSTSTWSDAYASTPRQPVQLGNNHPAHDAQSQSLSGGVASWRGGGGGSTGGVYMDNYHTDPRPKW